MIVDFDDLTEKSHRLDLLVRLREANPRFKATVFAIPYLCPDEFLESLPDWLEVAAHGWAHPHPREAADWTRDQALDVLLACRGRFVDGFKAPGWQISDGTYEAIEDLGWWVADHPDNNQRRPAGIRAHVYGDGDHWHGHIQNCCGNGIEETWDELLERVTAAESFEWISEAVRPWVPLVTA